MLGPLGCLIWLAYVALELSGALKRWQGG